MGSGVISSCVFAFMPKEEHNVNMYLMERYQDWDLTLSVHIYIKVIVLLIVPFLYLNCQTE